MNRNNFFYDDFLPYQNVSRETFDRLEQFVVVLKKWQKTINLVSAQTLQEIWKRHIVDSAQLYHYISENEKIADIGSGAGFPGVILGILGVPHLTLVESDKRKAAFLQEVAPLCKGNATVKNIRVEALGLDPYTTITARALASLTDILKLLANGLKPHHRLLLLKGENYKAEVAEAKKFYRFDYKVQKSLTSDTGVILSINNIYQGGM